jgi:hypothetical protein
VFPLRHDRQRLVARNLCERRVRIERSLSVNRQRQRALPDPNLGKHTGSANQGSSQHDRGMDGQTSIKISVLRGRAAPASSVERTYGSGLIRTFL